MRRIKNQRLGDAEVTQVLPAARADAEIAVEHLERHPRAHRPCVTAKAGRTGAEIAVAAIQYRDAGAPACGDRTQVERRMPARHNDGIRARLCDCVCNRSHVGAEKTLRLEMTAMRRWLNDAMRVAVGKRH